MSVVSAFSVSVVCVVNPPYLIIELMENGALDLFLRQVQDRRRLGVLLKYVKDVVAGMAYLSQRKFIHRVGVLLVCTTW